MPPFHVFLHALLPPGTQSVAVVQGVEVNALRWSTSQTVAPMAVSFEEATEQLQRLPRFLIEPDGSFVWVSPTQERPRWQVDGNLYDCQGRLVLVELKGCCPVRSFDHFAATCGHQVVPLMVEFVEAFVYVTVEEFRRWLQSTGASAP